jgi:hypothetical protein
MQLIEETHTEAGDPDIDEVGEFVATLFATPAGRLTACRDWTAHELVAHLAAGAAEEADLIEAHLAGAPARPTRPHEAREQPYRAMPDPQLRDELVRNAARLAVSLEQLAALDPADPVHFSGRPMTAADFAMHSRSECALHRWDLVGRDDAGWAMLGQPALTEHAFTVLTSMSTLPETPANRIARQRARADARLVLRSAPHDDVVVTLSAGVVSLARQPIDATQPDVELEPAARLLLLWGRREPSARINVHARDAGRRVLEMLLAG